MVPSLKLGKNVANKGCVGCSHYLIIVNFRGQILLRWSGPSWARLLRPYSFNSLHFEILGPLDTQLEPAALMVEKCATAKAWRLHIVPSRLMLQRALPFFRTIAISLL